MFASNYLEGQMAGLIPANSYCMPCDGYPGETGTGGTDMASARTLFEMAAVSGSSRSNNNVEDITITTAGRFRFLKWFDALTGGNFLGYSVAGNNTPQTFQLIDTSTDDFICVGHGFAAGDEVFFLQEPLGKALPTGITEGTVYYVISTGLTANAFRVSATSGGSAVSITATGAGLVCKISYRDFAVSEILRVGIGDATWTGF